MKVLKRPRIEIVIIRIPSYADKDFYIDNTFKMSSPF